jgi:signal transduction histidine kinase
MKWYHSLYWRIAIGVVVCLALLLVVQGLLFVWVVARTGSVPNQPPERLAQTVAFDVTEALRRDPALDVEQYVRQEYARDAQPFLVVLADGRTIEIAERFPQAMIDEARARLLTMRTRESALRARGGMGRPAERSPRAGDAEPQAGAAPPNPFRNGAPGMSGPFAGRGGRMGAGFRASRPAPVFGADGLVGLVVVPPAPPFRFLLARYAPALGIVAIATLVTGAALAAALIFGPARRRLRDLEAAAQRLGSGDLSARAPSGGRDEVAAVAAAFNAMADDLAARADALAASDRTRRQLLADVSHELTTPMTAIRGYLETLAMADLPVDERTRARYLGIVADETARLERIVGDLLDLARLEGGGASFSLADVPVQPLFERVAARHERVAADARVAMSIVVEPRAGIVHADAGRLEQALQNLAANALRYAPAGSTIELRAHAVDGTVTLTVSDAGPGIAAEHLPRVFDRFYKAEGSRAARQNAGGSGGSGLGLSIVKAIAERHGARVSVRSQPGHTTFEIAGLRRGGAP